MAQSEPPVWVVLAIIGILGFFLWHFIPVFMRSVSSLG